MTHPRLIFESTNHFSQSEIQPVFRSIGKWFVNPNLCAIIVPPGEKCGLARISHRAALQGPILLCQLSVLPMQKTACFIEMPDSGPDLSVCMRTALRERTHNDDRARGRGCAHHAGSAAGWLLPRLALHSRDSDGYDSIVPGARQCQAASQAKGPLDLSLSWLRPARRPDTRRRRQHPGSE